MQQKVFDRRWELQRFLHNVCTNLPKSTRSHTLDEHNVWSSNFPVSILEDCNEPEGLGGIIMCEEVIEQNVRGGNPGLEEGIINEPNKREYYDSKNDEKTC